MKDKDKFDKQADKSLKKLKLFYGKKEDDVSFDLLETKEQLTLAIKFLKSKSNTAKITGPEIDKFESLLLPLLNDDDKVGFTNVCLVIKHKFNSSGFIFKNSITYEMCLQSKSHKASATGDRANPRECAPCLTIYMANEKDSDAKRCAEVLCTVFKCFGNLISQDSPLAMDPSNQLKVFKSFIDKHACEKTANELTSKVLKGELTLLSKDKFV